MTTPPFEPAVPEPAPAPIPSVPVRRRSGSSRNLNGALGAAVLVATAGVAFAVGRASAAAATPAAVADAGFAGSAGGGPADASFGPNGGGFVIDGGSVVPGAVGEGGGPILFGARGMTLEGTVESITADSITIRTDTGQTVTVGLDAETTYHQQADATAADVAAGRTVLLRLGGGSRSGAAAGDGADDGDATGGSGPGALSLGTASDVTVVP